MSPKSQLVVFDFDWSYVDQDTDRYVLEYHYTPLRRELETLSKTKSMQYTDAVAHTVKRLQNEQGITKAQIEEALRDLPVHPAMKRATLGLKAASEPKSSFFLLSNSNQVYIDTILKHHRLTELFDRITTNPSKWDENDKLIINRRISPDATQHGCQVGCSPNMCKGEELDAYIKENGPFDRVIYVGDGGNDFCPILRLRPQDLALVRTHKELEERIAKEGASAGLKCQVKYWGMGWEIEEYFGPGGIGREF
ncbi:Predicted haloacid dehalogenase-like hydrolase [Phaffia rhodozyma]|uniref:Predicted haloacid dehalogenase-like hydrolase n=1 Tax=Phaffia rhodozyma TaxID=264483 RepID=A0A0F7SW29_PHARH|nr:Predicted haloacid dehalogenase-like hydrolase [Phaffia rhodozyma]